MSKHTLNLITRRHFLAGTSAAAIALAAGSVSSRAQAAGRRVILLGFDGVEPVLADALLAAGQLPNLAKLKAQGGYQRIASSNPPQSPTAWSSVATCQWAGGHGIYDFFKRDPAKYEARLGFGSLQQVQLAADGSVAQKQTFISERKGETFWAAADRQGARCSLLELPYAYPPEPLQHGRMLCGLDAPDIRGTQSTSFILIEGLPAKQDLGGGVNLPLTFQDNIATVSIPGFRHPKTRAFIEVPARITLDRANKRAIIAVAEHEVTLAENQWSDWFEWSFPLSPKFTVRAISRFCLTSAGEKAQVYMSCLQTHPHEPYVPICTPANYAAQLADQYGLFKTIGWSFDTKALERNGLTEDAFLDDIRTTMAFQEKRVLDELARGQFEILLAGWTETDRSAHMFWRFRDPKHSLYTPEGAKKYGQAVEDTYRKMDEIVGKTMAALEDGDLLMVMSDHGFHAYRYSFSINTWLARNGYLAVNGQTDPATAVSKKDFLMDFDWSKTKLYGFGFGSVYLNLKGREGNGIVDPAEAPALLAEIRERLLKETHPATGEKIFSEVYAGNVYHGASAQSAPDIQLGFADGFQNDKGSASGGVPKELITANDKKWSGDHAACDVAISPGILFSNQRLTEGASLVDLGVTALQHLGLQPLPQAEGRNLLTT